MEFEAYGRRSGTGEATLCLLDDLLAESDVVTLHLHLHLRLSDRTGGLLGRRELALMKQGPLLINTSRSAIVDTSALVAALDAGRAIDVFDLEPPGAGDRLASHQGVIATPHLGCVTRANYATFYGQAVEDIAA